MKGEVCYRHPFNETDLHCLQCGKPICTSCKQQTALGIYCPDCVLLIARGSSVGQEKFGETRDYVLAVLLPLLLGVISGSLALLIPDLGLWMIFIWLVSGFIWGTFIAKLFHYAVKERNGRYLAHTVATATFIGIALPSLVLSLIILGFGAIFGESTWARNGIDLFFFNTPVAFIAYLTSYMALR